MTVGGRQQFLTKLTEQEFSSSWKKRETFALLSMRSSLPVAAAAGSGSASEEAAARLLAAAERLGPSDSEPRRGRAQRLARGGRLRVGAR